MPRPRKAGPREPNGRLQRAQRTNYWQRQRDALVSGSLDSRLETPLGLLYRAERITTAEMEAGTWFAEARAAADAALSLPTRNCRAQDMNSLGGASTGQETDEAQRAKRRAVESYDKVCSWLGRGRQFEALEQVVILERRPDTYEQFLDLQQGLRLLVAYRMGRRAAA